MERSSISPSPSNHYLKAMARIGFHEMDLRKEEDQDQEENKA